LTIFPVVRLHVDDVAHGGAIRDPDLVDELARSRNAPDETHPVDVELGRCPQVALPERELGTGAVVGRRVGHDLGDRTRRSVCCAEPRRGVDGDVRDRDAVDGGQVPRSVQVGLDLAAEHRHVPVELLVGDVRPAELVLGRRDPDEPRLSLRAQDVLVLLDEVVGLGSGRA